MRSPRLSSAAVAPSLVCDVPRVFLSELFRLTEVTIRDRIVNVLALRHDSTFGGVFCLRFASFNIFIFRLGTHRGMPPEPDEQDAGRISSLHPDSFHGHSKSH